MYDNHRGSVCISIDDFKDCSKDIAKGITKPFSICKKDLYNFP